MESKTREAMRKAVSELFSNPASDRIVASLWLLTYCISQFKKKGARLQDIENTLNRELRLVRSQDNDFYLIWSSGYNLEDVLHRLSEVGILNEKLDKTIEKPLWMISKRGKTILNKRKNFAPLGITI